jgi:hypothetical protein
VGVYGQPPTVTRKLSSVFVRFRAPFNYNCLKGEKAFVGANISEFANFSVEEGAQLSCKDQNYC